MIEKVKRWKIRIGKHGYVLSMENGLVNKVINENGSNKIHKEILDLLGWNVYSVMRYLLRLQTIRIYRFNKKTDRWNKVKLRKIQQIVNKPMET